MATLKIPPVLRTEAGGVRLVEVSGGTVREALGQLIAAHPALERRIFDDGALPSFLNVFVDGDDIRLHSGLDTAVTEASTIVLLPAVAGGRDV
jgi:molybdopterin synthase sulfur carrier subunit